MYTVVGRPVMVHLQVHLGQGTFLIVTIIFMPARETGRTKHCCGKLCGLADIVELCDLNDDCDVIFRTQLDLKLCRKMVQNQQTQQNKRLH